MKFNEKLIDLRKKSGLSQEELGYKLNVTRQTVSKWELGQTTPEMDKLIEIGKLFNLSVDDLINDSVDVSGQAQKINDRPIGGSSMGNNKSALIIIAVFFVVSIGLVFFVFKGITGRMGSMFENFGSQKELMNHAIQSQKDILDIGKEQQNQLLEQQELEQQELENQIYQNQVNEMEEKRAEAEAKAEMERFNRSMESYAGTVQGGGFAMSALDEIMESNRKNDRKVTVVYGKTKTADITEIRELKRKIEKVSRLELYYEYDEEGYIYKAVFEKIK